MIEFEMDEDKLTSICQFSNLSSYTCTFLNQSFAIKQLFTPEQTIFLYGVGVHLQNLENKCDREYILKLFENDQNSLIGQYTIDARLVHDNDLYKVWFESPICINAGNTISIVFENAAPIDNTNQLLLGWGRPSGTSHTSTFTVNENSWKSAWWEAAIEFYFKLAPITLEFRVIGKNGEQISGAKIEIWKNNLLLEEVTADERGVAIVTSYNIDLGEYQVRVLRGVDQIMEKEILIREGSHSFILKES